MSPECPITEYDINALVDSELSGREQRRVAAHVAQCPSCSELAGAALGSKRLLQAKGQPLEAPAGAWSRLVAALDAADGVARAADAPRPQRRQVAVPALAACAVLMMVAAVAMHGFRDGRGVGHVAQFARSHEAASSVIHRGMSTGGHDVISTSPGRAEWSSQGRWLLPLNGEFVDHTFFRVGVTPISQFVVSSGVFDDRGLQPVRTSDGSRYMLRVERVGSVVAWEAGGLTHVLVGRVSPEYLLSLAETRRALGPTMRSM